MLGNKSAEASHQSLLNLCWSFSASPVCCAFPKPAPPLHAMALLKTVFACSSARTRQMACLQGNSCVTRWNDDPEGTLLWENRLKFTGEGGCCGDLNGRHHLTIHPHRVCLAAGIAPAKESLWLVSLAQTHHFPRISPK